MPTARGNVKLLLFIGKEHSIQPDTPFLPGTPAGAAAGSGVRGLCKRPLSSGLPGPSLGSGSGGGRGESEQPRVRELSQVTKSEALSA